LTFHPSKKVAQPLIRVRKKISSKLGVQGIKRSGILQKSRTWQKGKIFYRKTEFLGTWTILQKIVFLRTNLGELLDARVLLIF
jgi:hypothetical protein